MRAAALDRGELFLVAGENHFAAVAGRVADRWPHRWVIETIEPSSTTISEPAGMRPWSMSASSRVVFAATCTPALRNSFVAFWEVAVPNTRPGSPVGPGLRCGRERAGLAGARGPDDHLHGPAGGEHVVDGGGLVETQPALRDVLARAVRALAQLCLEQRGVCAEPQRCLFGRQVRRALRLGLRDQPLLGGQLRGRGVAFGAWPRVDAAAVQVAAQRVGQRRPFAGPPARRPASMSPDSASSARPSSSVCAAPGGICRVCAGITSASCLISSCLVQVDFFSDTSASALRTDPYLRLTRQVGPPVLGRRPGPSAAVVVPVRAPGVRYLGGDARQFAADRGVPPFGQRIPVDLTRSLLLRDWSVASWAM